MKNIAEKIRKYAKPYLLLILLIAAQLIYTSFCFVSRAAIRMRYGATDLRTATISHSST